MAHAVLNIQHAADFRHAVYVGRPSPLGNPFAIGSNGDRDQVIERYRHWLDARVNERDPVVCTALLGIHPGQPLACHCAPARCHGEVIAELLDGGVQERLRKPVSHALRYAGIGSRNSPDPILRTMRKISHRLSELGYTLLSGGAAGADTAFEVGSFGQKEIYLPWPGFRHRQGHHCVTLPSAEACRVAQTMHPAWNRLNGTAQALMARNSHQILGAALRSPVKFVVCWTPDGCETEASRSRATGGTGQAIALADRWGVPIVNLARGKPAMERLAALVTT